MRQLYGCCVNMLSFMSGSIAKWGGGFTFYQRRRVPGQCSIKQVPVRLNRLDLNKDIDISQYEIFEIFVRLF